MGAKAVLTRSGFYIAGLIRACSRLLIRCSLCVALTPVSASAQERFDDRLWGVDLLVLLSAGPVLLGADLNVGLSTPPGPEETRSELDRMELISSRLRAEEADRIIMEAAAEPEQLLFDAGFIPSRGEAPELWGLLEAATGEATYFALREKRRFARARPTQIRPRIGAVIPIPPHPAYPSGHSTQIHTVSGLLEVMYPACAEAYRLFAAGVAFRREIAGVHFPSDTRAGELLAHTLVSHLIAHPTLSAPFLAGSEQLATHVRSGGCQGPEALR